MKIRAICLDAENKPTIIPESLWVKKGVEYNITGILKCFFGEQQGIQGVLLAEFDISAYVPYNCYKMSRFAIHQDDLDKFKQMVEESIELNKIGIEAIMQELETIEIYDNN